MYALFYALEPLTIIVTLAAGIVLGYWGHILNSKRAREAREHADKLARDARLASYEAFLLEWEQTIERTTDENTTKSIYYDLAASQFRSEAAKIRRDFADRTAFNRLDEALSRISPEVLDRDGTKTRRETLADRIRPLIRYVQAA